MRLSLRGWALMLVVALALGMTAHLWDPYTRHLPTVKVAQPCTPSHHTWPCIANGDNEPTWPLPYVVQDEVGGPADMHTWCLIYSDPTDHAERMYQRCADGRTTTTDVG